MADVLRGSSRVRWHACTVFLEELAQVADRGLVEDNAWSRPLMTQCSRAYHQGQRTTPHMEVLGGRLIQGQPVMHVQGTCAIGIDVAPQQWRQRPSIRFRQSILPCWIG